MVQEAATVVDALLVSVVPHRLRRLARRERAGRSALRQYRSMRAVWRRRVQWRLAAVLGVVAVMVVVPAHLLAAWSPRWVWGAGVSAGVWLTMLVALRDAVPAHIARWELGAWAERWTAAAVRPLARRGWTVLHDRALGGGNLDHLLIGPGGVHLLDTKRWEGTTSIEDDVPVVRRLEDETLPASRFERLPASIKSTAARVHRGLAHRGLPGIWVQPVVVIWGRFPQRVVETGDGMVYVHGDEVAGWLRARPRRLQEPAVSAVAAAARAGLARA